MKCLWLLAISLLLGCERHTPDPTWARMLSQRRADPYDGTTAFPDGKVLQAPPPNTVPRDDDSDDPAPPVDRALVELGRARYAMACAQCHGVVGDGHSFVAQKMELRKPPSFLDARAYSKDRIFAAETGGYGLMPALAHLLSRRERWAIVAYVDALQLRRVRKADLSPELQATLETEAR